MAFPIDPEWKLNITTEDIVYPFADCTKTVYRKQTIKLKMANGITTAVTAISEIKYQRDGSKTERMLSDAEFSVEQFDATKEWSDAEYKKQVRSYVNSNRKCVTRVDDLLDCPSIAVYEKFAGDEEDEETHRTAENALRIIEAMKLTDVQHRRLRKSIDGLSSYEIAESEGVRHQSVLETLNAVEKKRQKVFSKFLSETAPKHPAKKRKN